MVVPTVIRQIGNLSGVALPQPMLDRMHLRQGETVYLVEVFEGILLTVDPAVGDVVKAYREGMQRYRNAMKELAGE